MGVGVGSNVVVIRFPLVVWIPIRLSFKGATGSGCLLNHIPAFLYG